MRCHPNWRTLAPLNLVFAGPLHLYLPGTKLPAMCTASRHDEAGLSLAGGCPALPLHLPPPSPTFHCSLFHLPRGINQPSRENGGNKQASPTSWNLCSSTPPALYQHYTLLLDEPMLGTEHARLPSTLDVSHMPQPFHIPCHHTLFCISLEPREPFTVASTTSSTTTASLPKLRPAASWAWTRNILFRQQKPEPLESKRLGHRNKAPVLPASASRVHGVLGELAAS